MDPGVLSWEDPQSRGKLTHSQDIVVPLRGSSSQAPQTSPDVYRRKIKKESVLLREPFRQSLETIEDGTHAPLNPDGI